MSIKSFFKFTTALLLMVALMTSCEKSEDLIINANAQEPASSFMNSFNKNGSNENGMDSLDCYQINYPITLLFPDGIEQEVSSDVELDILLDEWFKANEEAEDYPQIKFPIDITLADGTTQSVESEEQLDMLYEDCNSHEDCEYFDDYDGEIEDLCFSIVYPVTIVFPDGNTQVADSDDNLENLIELWYVSNPQSDQDPTLDYPINVTLEDGSLQEITSEDEIENLIDSCFPEDYDDDYDYDEDKYGYGEDGFCFTIVFPITVSFPDGTTQEANNEGDLDSLFDLYYEANSDDADDPTFVFPITVILKDSTSQDVTTEEDFEALYEDCFDDYGEFDDVDSCFTISFPVNILLPDGTLISADSEEDLEEIFVQWYDANKDSTEDPTFEFPISITLEDGTIQEITSEAELETVYENCYNG